MSNISMYLKAKDVADINATIAERITLRNVAKVADSCISFIDLQSHLFGFGKIKADTQPHEILSDEILDSALQKFLEHRSDQNEILKKHGGVDNLRKYFLAPEGSGKLKQLIQKRQKELAEVEERIRIYETVKERFVQRIKTDIQNSAPYNHEFEQLLINKGNITKDAEKLKKYLHRDIQAESETFMLWFRQSGGTEEIAKILEQHEIKIAEEKRLPNRMRAWREAAWQTTVGLAKSFGYRSPKINTLVEKAAPYSKEIKNPAAWGVVAKIIVAAVPLVTLSYVAHFRDIAPSERDVPQLTTTSPVASVVKETVGKFISIPGLTVLLTDQAKLNEATVKTWSIGDVPKIKLPPVLGNQEAMQELVYDENTGFKLLNESPKDPSAGAEMFVKGADLVTKDKLKGPLANKAELNGAYVKTWGIGGIAKDFGRACAIVQRIASKHRTLTPPFEKFVSGFQNLFGKKCKLLVTNPSPIV